MKSVNVKEILRACLQQVHDFDFEAAAARHVAIAEATAQSIRIAGARAKAWAARCPEIAQHLVHPSGDRGDDELAFELLGHADDGAFGENLQSWAECRFDPIIQNRARCIGTPAIQFATQQTARDEVDAIPFTESALEMASRAAALFLWGQDKAMDQFDMSPSGSRFVSVAFEGWRRLLENRKYYSNPVGHGMGQLYLICSLLGKAAQGKIEPDVIWFGKLMAPFFDPSPKAITHQDMNAAFNVANAMSNGHEVNTEHYICQAADWCEELVVHPKVWKLIIAVAAKLTYDERADTDEIRRTMQTTWGPNGGMPLLELGKKWTERLKECEDDWQSALRCTNDCIHALPKRK